MVRRMNIRPGLRPPKEACKEGDKHQLVYRIFYEGSVQLIVCFKKVSCAKMNHLHTCTEMEEKRKAPSWEKF